jgi:GMP synthase (glutamine-hydrolysing)
VNIHCLQHVPFEGPAAIAQWAAARGHSLATTPLHADDPLPPIGEIDRLVVMGGPMNIYEEDRYPWLAREKRFIGEAVAAGKTVVGVCLGAQLLADVLGAKVRRNRQKEIGWFPVEWTAAARRSAMFGFLPERLEAFHWHGDTFDLPAGALHLARSEACENQAFLWDGRVLGLQFHLEATAQSVRLLTENCADELVPGPFIQTAGEILAGGLDRFRRIHELMFRILDRLPDGTRTNVNFQPPRK